MIKVEVVNDEITLGLSRIADRTDDMRPVMAGISSVLLSAVEENFDEERDPETGEKWQDLAESTKEARKKKGKFPGKILQVSAGGLAASMSMDYGNDYAQVSTNKPYAAIHQFGGKAGRNRSVTIPQRRYMGLTEPQKEDVLDVVDQYLLGR